MPAKHLPAAVNLDDLMSQAREILDDFERGGLEARRRLREFHPRFGLASDAELAAASLTWSDALLTVAHEYGFASWARLKRQLPERSGEPASLTERIGDLKLREAVELLDDGDIDALRSLLKNDPALLERRANFEGETYFRTPTLLGFIAENPTRNLALPPNIVALTELLLNAGAGRHKADLDETLALVSSGRVARECGVQSPLIALLCSRGANPNVAIVPALAHGEFNAVRTLLDSGAAFSFAVAASFGDINAVRAMVNMSTQNDRHLALALAALHGRAPIIELLIAQGEDPNRHNPSGAHAHATPLHLAAQNGDIATARALLEGGARTDLKDIIWKATPADWADHAGHHDLADFLQKQGRAAV